MSNHDNLDRKNRRKAAREASKLPKNKRKKLKNGRKRAKKVAKRKAAGVCEHCGKKSCIKETAEATPSPVAA